MTARDRPRSASRKRSTPRGKRSARRPAVLEQFVPFEREISVVAARNAKGDVVAYEPAENLHRDHILHRSRVPAQIPGALAGQAGVIASKIAAALNYVGVLAVEMFVLDDGGKKRLCS
jgi:5-(carboxyamino)imidazole ribonucleotide synthase